MRSPVWWLNGDRKKSSTNQIGQNHDTANGTDRPGYSRDDANSEPNAPAIAGKWPSPMARSPIWQWWPRWFPTRRNGDASGGSSCSSASTGSPRPSIDAIAIALPSKLPTASCGAWSPSPRPTRFQFQTFVSLLRRSIERLYDAVMAIPMPALSVKSCTTVLAFHGCKLADWRSDWHRRIHLTSRNLC